ncbi:unnamed protein product, partial [Amoebophrya sp. A120]|eukprot:GSA120T00021342001.1
MPSGRKRRRKKAKSQYDTTSSPLHHDYRSKIEFFKCDAQKLPIDRNSVDIIISEWMGYLLLYESMCDVIVNCRDLYLKPDGLMFPDRCCIYLAGCDDAKKYHEQVQKKFPLSEALEKNQPSQAKFISDDKNSARPFTGRKEGEVHQEFSKLHLEDPTPISFAPFTSELVFKNAIVAEVEHRELISTPARVFDIDLRTVTVPELDFKTAFELQV